MDNDAITDVTVNLSTCMPAHLLAWLPAWLPGCLSLSLSLSLSLGHLVARRIQGHLDV